MKRFGYGKVHKIKRKNAVNWIISCKLGAMDLLSHINGHLRTKEKLVQIHQNMTKYIGCDFQQTPNKSNLLDTWWLVGFTEAEGSFYIQILSPRPSRKNHEIRVHYKFNIQHRAIVDQLKNTFGSSVYKRLHRTMDKKTNNYWSSTS